MRRSEIDIEQRPKQHEADESGVEHEYIVAHSLEVGIGEQFEPEEEQGRGNGSNHGQADPDRQGQIASQRDNPGCQQTDYPNNAQSNSPGLIWIDELMQLTEN